MGARAKPGQVPKSAAARFERGGGGPYPCPHPGCTETRSTVVDSRPTITAIGIRRRRICPAGHRYTTIEALLIEGRSSQPEIAALMAMAEQAQQLADKLTARAAQAQEHATAAGDTTP